MLGPRRGTTPQRTKKIFQGALDSYSALSKGWLRASKRKLGPVLSTPSRPYHAHDEIQPLTPGQTHQVDIEIWPTCVVLAPRLPCRADRPRRRLEVSRYRESGTPTQFLCAAAGFGAIPTQ
ncbi:MAG: uncharacterized protein QOI01_4288 [Mycobacterium sp.]|jgi:hypothetical protein|nr:uncharacterized protein [Mycobacterium sp.]